MRTASRIALVIGIGAMIILIASENARSLLALLSHAGWRLLLLVPFNALPLLLDVLSWRALIFTASTVPVLFLIASIRQAINRLLPVANIGGEIVGVRLLARCGVNGAMAAASVIVEIMITLLAQYVFVVLGLACVLRATDTVRPSGGVLLGLGATLPVLVLIIAIVRNGAIFTRIEQWAKRLLGSDPHAPGAFRGTEVDAGIEKIFAVPRALFRGFAWQFSSLIAGCAETWLALRWLGHPVGFAEAVALESLTLAARSIFFMMPAALGVQEAGFIGVGHALGLGSDVALALSLAKRMREILYGLPALAVWQRLEMGTDPGNGQKRGAIQ